MLDRLQMTRSGVIFTGLFGAIGIACLACAALCGIWGALDAVGIWRLVAASAFVGEAMVAYLVARKVVREDRRLRATGWR